MKFKTLKNEYKLYYCHQLCLQDTEREMIKGTEKY